MRLCDKVGLPVYVTRFFTCVWSFHYFLIFSLSLRSVMRTFAKQSLQSALNVSKVNQSLESVRLLASRPAALLDPFSLLAALEQLSDHAREANHPQRKKFDAIFKQCRALANSNSLAEVVLQLLGDKEERDVASQIRKIFKGHSSPRSLAPGQAFVLGGDNSVVPRPGPYLGGSFGRGGRFRPQYYRPGTFPRRCFNCRRVGHFARNCPLVSKVVKK